MWVLCEYLAEELMKYGFEVGKTRTDAESDLPVVKRGKMAEGFDLFLSLHSNAANDPSVDRVDVYAAYDNLNGSHVLALQFAEAIAKLMGVSGGRVKTRKSERGDWEYYGVLRGARSVGCPLFYIVEHSFHTNEASALWLLEDENLRRLAVAEAAVIAGYYGVSKLGDVDGNGELDMFDLMLIKNAVLGGSVLTEQQKTAADADKNGEIDMYDYLSAKTEYFKS